MSANDNIELQERLRRWSRYLNLIIVFIGILVLVGWQLDIEFLKRPLPYLVAMNPLSALTFIASSVAFLLLTSRNNSKRRQVVAEAFVILVLLISSMKLSEVIFGFEWQIDRILFAEKLQFDLAGNVSNHMAPNTAFNFALTGMALLILNFETPKKRMPSHYLALIIAFLGLFSLLGYVYKVQAFYGVLPYIPMAIHTAVCFLFMALAILFANPGKGIMIEFTSTYAGSITARILIPTAIVVPILLGFLRLLGHWTETYTTEFGVAILVFSIIISFLFLIRYNTVLLNQRDKERQEAEEKLVLFNLELEQKVAERTEEVVKNEKRFRSMIESSHDAIGLLNESGEIMYASPAATKIDGFTQEELKGRKGMGQVHPDDTHKVSKLMENVFKNPGKAIFSQHRIQHKLGHWVWTEGTMTNFLNEPAINALVANFRDITERKKAEDIIRKAETSYREIFDKAADAIYIHEIETGKVLEVNQKASEITGYTKEELLSSNLQDFITDNPEYSLQKAISYLQKAATSMPQLFEWLGKIKDGSYNWFEVNLKKATIAGEERILAFFREINDRKKTQEEIKVLNEGLEQKVIERIAQLEAVNKELESFSYSVSHDLRSPLRAIDGYAKILNEDYSSKLDEEGKRIIETINYNATKMGTLIDELLAFSRLGQREIRKTEIDMNELAEGVMIEIGKSMTHNEKIKISKLHKTKGDYGLLYQVMFNLVSNAVKYSSKKETPAVEIFSEEKNDEIIFSVKDNGAGFDMQHADKLFGVFQRLHSQEEFEGTGVGLAIVQRVIAKHGGKVWAEGKINEGAVFYFTLPKN